MNDERSPKSEIPNPFGISWLRFVSSFVIRHLSAAGALLTVIATPLFGQETLGEPEERVIHYNSSEGLADPVARLQKRLAEGTAQPPVDSAPRYLSSLLQP